MSEGHSELSRPLLVGRKSDGRAVYDRHAKRELIGICLQSGRSIAAIAREHGLNANLFHNWVAGHRRRLAAGDFPASSFLPVHIMRSTPSMPVVPRDRGDETVPFSGETKVPVRVITVANPEIAGMDPADYEVIGQKFTYRLASFRAPMRS